MKSEIDNRKLEMPRRWRGPRVDEATGRLAEIDFGSGAQIGVLDESGRPVMIPLGDYLDEKKILDEQKKSRQRLKGLPNF